MILKEWWAYALGVLYALVPLYMIRLDGLDPGGIVFTGCMVLAAGIFGTTIAEKLEGKSDGYRFLLTLPVGAREIVRAKFAAPIAVGVVSTAIISLVLPRLSEASGMIAAARLAVTVAAALGLVSVGIVYTVLYLSNCNEKVRTIMLILPSGVIVVMLAAYMLMRSEIKGMDFSPFESVGTFRWMLLIAAAGLAIYALLFRAALASFRKRVRL